MGSAYRVGGLDVRVDERRVLRDGAPLALGARAFDLLLALIAHRDRVVGKDELLALAWPGLVVEENNLSVQVSALRKLFGADAIATVAGRGYRFALRVDEAAAAPPAAAATTPPPHNLPPERSSFVGRAAEVAAVRQALAAHALVTLTGIGGSGKTRLALQVGALELARFADGVFFVDLAPVADPELVPHTLAAACGLAPGDSVVGGGRSLADRLVAVLAPRHALLLVDNCEHLLDAVAALADRLLAGAPRLVLLATSREALGIEGEQVLQVPSLAVPAADEAAGPAVTDAMQLFADRAQAVQADFRLDAATRPAVAEICRRLDGIPLAIEFAAARVAHLSPAQIAERLSDRFHLLTGGRRRIARQQTLAAALDWSHDLLAEAEQRLFRRLAVFVGAFTLGAAEGVCARDGVDPAELLDRLASLVAKSLVTVVPGTSGQTRYRLLETVRLYALDKLDAAGEAAALRSRHRDHLLAWLEAMPLERIWFDEAVIANLAHEVDNLRAAADWCVADRRSELLARLVVQMSGYWFSGNAYRAARAWLGHALADADRLSADERLAAHATQAWLSTLAQDFDALLDHAERGAALAAGRATPAAMYTFGLRAFAQAVRASIPGAQAHCIEGARRDAAASLALARGLHPVWRAEAELTFGLIETHVGAHEAAVGWYAASLRSCAAAGFGDRVRMSASGGLASALFLLGRHAEGLQAGLDGVAAIESSAAAHWPLVEIWALEVAPALHAGGRPDLADQALRRAAQTVLRNGVDLAANHFFGIAAVLELLRGRPEPAAVLLGAARSAGGADRVTMAFRTPASLAYYMHALDRVRAALGPTEARRARDAGRALSIEQAFERVLRGLDAGG
jgi:predicted ATPase/DNA-binding winged helix-turn-helix (wHTH) protein